MKKPKLIYQKNAEKSKHKIVLPKACIEKWGNKYYLEIYDDYMKLVPMEKEK